MAYDGAIYKVSNGHRRNVLGFNVSSLVLAQKSNVRFTVCDRRSVDVFMGVEHCMQDF